MQEGQAAWLFLGPALPLPEPLFELEEPSDFFAVAGFESLLLPLESELLELLDEEVAEELEEPEGLPLWSGWLCFARPYSVS